MTLLNTKRSGSDAPRQMSKFTLPERLPSPRDVGERATVKAAQRLNRSSGLLAASVLLDSDVEH